MVYASIGVIALLSFLKVRQGGADESSLLAILHNSITGTILIWVILLGTACYVVWRFYEALTDPYEYGRHSKGLARRTGIALSTMADGMIVYAAVRVLLGVSHIQSDGQPLEEREMVQRLLEGPGPWVVIAIGLVYLVTALVQLFYGFTNGFRERVNIERFPRPFQKVVHWLAWAGYAARGWILGIIGFFFVKAGWLKEARHVVNTDKAFDFIGDHIGHVWFIGVAVATTCYGLFMFVQAIAYDVDRD